MSAPVVKAARDVVAAWERDPHMGGRAMLAAVSRLAAAVHDLDMHGEDARREVAGPVVCGECSTRYDADSCVRVGEVCPRAGCGGRLA